MIFSGIKITALLMEAESTSEFLVNIYQTLWYKFPEGNNFK
jgi:hypothetical protein